MFLHSSLEVFTLPKIGISFWFCVLIVRFFFIRRVNREKETLANENMSASKLRDNDIDKLELEITQLNTERDQLVRQLEKSQDMLLSFQQDLNMTEGELKRVTNENKRLREESGASEKGMCYLQYSKQMIIIYYSGILNYLF